MPMKSKSSSDSKKSASRGTKVVAESYRTERVEQKMESSPKMESPPEKNRTLQEILANADSAQIDKLSRNLSQAMFESQEIMRQVTTKNLKQSLDPGSSDPFGASQALSKVGENIARHPDRLFAAQMDLWEGHLNAWRSILTNPETKDTKDKRFADPEWKDNPAFSLIRQSYELNSNFLMNLIGSAEELDETTRLKANFFAKQTADAFCPTNFFTTNPAALKAMLETGGESVLEGLKLAKSDIERGHGRLLISQTDGSEFKIGENVGTAPGKVVYRNDLIELIQYEPTTKKVFETPLLIFPPWINKFYILDLRKENSMIRWLTSKGLTVFVVSWRSADASMADFRWDDYVSEGAYAATEAVIELTGVEKINTVGYCIGGTMLTSALGRMALENDDRIQSATYFASQADFSDAGELKVFTDEQSLKHIEQVIKKNGGVMAGEDMSETFNYLRPSDLVWRYVVDSYMMGKKPRPFDLLYWNSDQTNIPGPTHMTYLRDLYCNNALANGEFRVLGRKVKISDIKIPVLIQAAREDHISPFKSVYNTARAFGGPAELVLAGSGHIAGVVNHPDAKKYQHWTNSDLPESTDEWLEGAEEHPGSWWPHWFKWLKPLSGEKIDAKPVDDKGLGAAPGSYVLGKLEDLGVGPLSK